jgi:5-(carboxyamino)imidazole ribonucleotide mutase
VTNPLVAVLMGSKNDEQLLEPTTKVLDDLGIPYVTRAMSAHRTPTRCASSPSARATASRSHLRCGRRGHLPGAVAAQTTLPVIGIPASSEVAGGLDTVYEAPDAAGVAVAGVAVGAWGRAQRRIPRRRHPRPQAPRNSRILQRIPRPPIEGIRPVRLTARASASMRPDPLSDVRPSRLCRAVSQYGPTLRVVAVSQ